MLGELYSAAFTAPAFNWLCSPAVTELETIVLDWLAKILALPDCFLSQGEGGGVIQGSASEAVVTVMIAARERFLKQTVGDLQGDEAEDKKAFIQSRLVALGSEEAHSGTAKAAKILGLRYRSIASTLKDDLALTGRGLQSALDDWARPLPAQSIDSKRSRGSQSRIPNFGFMLTQHTQVLLWCVRNISTWQDHLTPSTASTSICTNGS